MSELAAFLQWNTPNLLADEIREASCHWLLLKGLGLDPGQGRPCADLQSLVLPMEEWQLSITTAAFYSAPEQQEPNPIQFRIPLTAANALVFALFSGQTTPLDPAEWSFWLVPVSKLHPERQTMGLNPLMRAFGEGLTYGALLEQLKPSQAVFRIVVDEDCANRSTSDPLAGQEFESYDAAYDVLERYYADVCCSDERSYYRIEEHSSV